MPSYGTYKWKLIKKKSNSTYHQSILLYYCQTNSQCSNSNSWLFLDRFCDTCKEEFPSTVLEKIRYSICASKIASYFSKTVGLLLSKCSKTFYKKNIFMYIENCEELWKTIESERRFRDFNKIWILLGKKGENKSVYM